MDEPSPPIPPESSEMELLAREVRGQMLLPWQRLIIMLSFLAAVGLWLAFAALPVFDSSASDNATLSLAPSGPSHGDIVRMFLTFLFIPAVPLTLMTVFASQARRRR